MPAQSKHLFKRIYVFCKPKSRRSLMDYIVASNSVRQLHSMLLKLRLRHSLIHKIYFLNGESANKILAKSIPATGLLARIFRSPILLTISLFYVGASTSLAKTNAKTNAITKTSHPDCGQDIFEPNNYRSRARNLSKELKNDREITATICDQDHDWYTVWLNKGELVEFTISSALDESPSLSVYAPRKRKASGMLHRVSPSVKKLKVYAKKSGRYRLHVKASRKSHARYTLSYNKPLY